jgi:DNA helicase-2/ATP-dependent DNA helicase PcrA
MTEFIPRPSQEQILRYRGGRLGIAAVPGAGKTQILSALAAQIIASGMIGTDQEVLIVTLVNSAVDNFEARVKRFFDNPLQALYRYRVRTLHGLAHDIVREKPGHVGLDERFAIIDEREADFIRREAVKAWMSAHADSLDDYLDPNIDDHKRDWVRRDQMPEMISNLALGFIRSAKDRRLTPEKLRALLDRQPAPLPLAELGLEIYSDYQRALTYRAAVDFDDLIRLALEILELDEEYLERVRYRFPYILEDEAQDSSRLQQDILGLLSGPGGNWVRVGDPNQAIFETFTTASPELLREFIAENSSVDMPESGRSQQSIIDLANFFIEWVMNEHPIEEARNALAPPYIVPVPPGDPQPNPETDRSAIYFVSKRLTAEEETKAIVDSLSKWLPKNPDSTVAVLVPRNNRGVEVINALRVKNIQHVEFLSSTSNTRAAAGALSNVIAYLADPQSAPKLAKAYQVWRRAWKNVKERAVLIHDTSAWLRKVGNVEDFVNPNLAFARGEALRPSPRPSGGPLPGGEGEAYSLSPRERARVREEPSDYGETEQVLAELNDFRVYVRRWLEAVTLPIDQLVLTLAQDIFTEAADLALAHKLALVLRKAADDHTEWRLPELTAELAVIARNERRFIGFSADDSGFDPEQHKGKVVVTTMHKAKGLEWDRVYLMSVNNYDFPSNQPNDRFISERWFLRDNLNMEAEALAQLNAATSSGEYDWYDEGAATLASRVDYVKERLRLFYVGITRAKRELIVTWNTGRQGDATPSLALSALMGWWESEGSKQ